MMTKSDIAGGVAHRMSADFRKAVASDPLVKDVWADITPLARNEWICWVTSAKQDDTRHRRISMGAVSGFRRMTLILLYICDKE